MKKTRFYSGDTFEHNGHEFRFEVEFDDSMREPWKEHDGHGIVSDWRRYEEYDSPKYPGERVVLVKGSE